jgi:hypothetical protein
MPILYTLLFICHSIQVLHFHCKFLLFNLLPLPATELSTQVVVKDSFSFEVNVNFYDSLSVDVLIFKLDNKCTLRPTGLAIYLGPSHVFR